MKTEQELRVELSYAQQMKDASEKLYIGACFMGQAEAAEQFRTQVLTYQEQILDLWAPLSAITRQKVERGT